LRPDPKTCAGSQKIFDRVAEMFYADA